MRAISVVLVAAMLATPGPGYGQQFRERWDEVQEQLSWGLPSLSETVLAKIEDQFEKRDAVIANARKNHLQNGSTSNLEEHAKWQDFLQREAEAQQKAFTDIAAVAIDLIEVAARPPSDLPMEYLAQLRNEVPQRVLSVGSQMVAFHAKLKAMQIAQLRDQLIRNRYNYQEEIDNLAGKLRTIESSDDSIDSSTRSERSALLNACNVLSRVKTEAERDLPRLAQSLVEAEDASQAERAGDDLLERIDQVVDGLEDFADAVDVGLDRLDGAFDREWAIVKMFSEARKAVKEFETKNNYDSASRRFAEMQQASTNAAGTMKHAGDQKDLKAVVVLAIADVQRHLADFKSDYDKFTGAFRGKLLGPIDSAQNERLAEFAEWDRWADDAGRCAPVDILNNLSSSEEREWGVNPDRMADPEARRVAERTLIDAGVRLQAGIGPAMEQAKRLQNLVQLQDRQKMRDALARS